jgi:H+-transporting ATPase
MNLTQLRITAFMMSISTVLVGIALGVLLARGEDIYESVAFCVILLVASIPIAMPLVSVVTMSLGSRKLSEQGAIVTRLAAIEEMAGMDMLCSDKTGTLTKNIMELQEEIPTFTDGIGREDVLRYAALAAKWKEPPKDALDTLVLKSFDPDAEQGAPYPRPLLMKTMEPYSMIDHVPFNPSVRRTESTIQGPDGVFKVTKGAPHVILHMAHNCREIEARVNEVVDGYAQRGVRCLSVARSQTVASEDELAGGEEQWEYLGVITFLDPPREDTAQTVAACRELGVQVKMITGDQVLIAQEMARQIGLGTQILLSDQIPDLPADKKAPADTGAKYGPMIERTDGFAQVFPEHKFMIERPQWDDLGRGAGRLRHRADGAGPPHHRHCHHHRAHDLPAPAQLRHLPHRLHHPAAALFLHRGGGDRGAFFQRDVPGVRHGSARLRSGAARDGCLCDTMRRQSG